MHNFEVTDDLSMDMSPTVIMPEGRQFAFNASPGTPAIGLRIGFSF